MDYTPLIERIRDAYPKFIAFTDIPHMASEAADALEALQAQLTTEHMNCLMLEGSLKTLQARVADLQSQVNSLNVGFNNCQMDRNSALAKLAALNEQKPSAWLSPRGALYRTRFEAVQNFEQVADPLYLAAGAQAQPLIAAEKAAMWKAATIEQCSHENCYLRGIIDAEKAHKIGGSV
jgi:hypothetical protein